jgi:xanthine permease XanP
VITSRMLDVRKTFVVGLSLYFELSVEMVPGLFDDLPAVVRPLFGSTLALGTVLVVLLNLLFRIGIKKRKLFELVAGEDGATRILEFMDTQGGAWGARPDVMKRVGAALVEVYETAVALNLATGPIRIAVSFDEFNVDAEVDYAGQPMMLSRSLPTEAELLRDGGVASMSGFLISRYADRIRVHSTSGRASVTLHFEH